MKQLLLALLVVAASVRPANAGTFEWLGLSLYAAKAGDSISTELALQRAGTREANPFLQNRYSRFGISVASSYAIHYSTARLHRTHPRLALWLRIGVIAGWSGAAIHNLRVGR